MPHARSRLRAKGIHLENVAVAPSLRRSFLDPLLEEILSETMSICSFFNHTRNQQTLDVFTFQEMSFSILSRLLRFRTLNESERESDSTAAHHVGLVIFIMSMFLSLNHGRVVDFSPVSRCLSGVIEAELEELQDDFVLWLMILGSVWLSADSESDWLVARLAMSAKRMGIETWNEAQSRVCGFPWLNKLHDQLGHEIWTRMRCQCLG